MRYNNVLDLTPRNIAALRGVLMTGAVQHRRYMQESGCAAL